MKNAFEYEAELTALREELAKVNREKNDVAYRANETAERLNSMTISKAAMRNKLKQRLTAAAQRNEDLCQLIRELTANGLTLNAAYRKRVDAALKPTESGGAQ